MLGRKLQVPLDVITSTPPDASTLKADYAKPVQTGCAMEYDLAGQHLNKVAICQKWIYDKQLGGRTLTGGDFVWLHNGGRKKPYS